MNDPHASDVGRLAGLDLNVLVALDAMLATGSVTQAARTLGVTQSAMSHTLRRARDLLDDPLLVRHGDAMLPTPRAEALRGPLRDALVTLGRVLHAPSFDPATARRRFRLTAPDLFGLLVLPSICLRLAIEAPGVDLVVLPGAPRDDADLAIVPDQLWAAGPDRPSEVLQRGVRQDGYACFASGDGRMDLDNYVARPHVVVSPTGEGASPVDDALAALGRSRRVAVRVPSFAEAVALVNATPLLLTAPRALARLLDPDRVTTHVLPFTLPRQSLAMRWHARLDADPGHRWFRGLVRDAAEGVLDGAHAPTAG